MLDKDALYPIKVLYDLRELDTAEKSMYVLNLLSSRGVAFEAVQNAGRGVVIVVKGREYSPDDIEMHGKDILGQIEKVDNANRERVVRARESELARMS